MRAMPSPTSSTRRVVERHGAHDLDFDLSPPLEPRGAAGRGHGAQQIEAPLAAHHLEGVDQQVARAAPQGALEERPLVLVGDDRAGEQRFDSGLAREHLGQRLELREQLVLARALRRQGEERFRPDLGHRRLPLRAAGHGAQLAFSPARRAIDSRIRRS
jgi:hypothetical protein